MAGARVCVRTPARWLAGGGAGYPRRSELFPLDGAGRFRANVVDDAVDAGYFVYDAGGDALQNLVRHSGPIGSHGVFRSDNANRHGVSVTTLIAHHAHAANRQKDSKSLPSLFVELSASNFPHYDGIRFAKRLQPFRADFSQQPNRETGPGKRLLGEDFVRQSQFAPDAANFVFEKLAQRLDQFERQVFGEATHVVVRFDRCTVATHLNPFDAVGIESALDAITDFAQLAGPVQRRIVNI